MTMQQQATVTVSGFLGGDPVRFGADETRGCSFRVGVTPRYHDRREQVWKDRETTWVSVRAFRTLADHVVTTLRRGMPVIVVGALRTQRWTKDGVDRITPVVEASAVGLDLNHGTAMFRRAIAADRTRPASGAAPGTAAATPSPVDVVGAADAGDTAGGTPPTGQTPAGPAANGLPANGLPSNGVPGNDAPAAGTASGPGNDPWPEEPGDDGGDPAF